MSIWEKGANEKKKTKAGKIKGKNAKEEKRGKKLAFRKL